MITPQDTIYPLRYLSRSYRAITDSQMKIINCGNSLWSSDLVREQREWTTGVVSKYFGRSKDFPPLELIEGCAPFCQTSLTAIDFLTTAYETNQHRPSLMAVHHIHHHVRFGDRRPFCTGILLCLPRSLRFVENDHSLGRSWSFVLVVVISKSVDTLNK